MKRYPFEIGDLIIYQGKSKVLKKNLGKKLYRFVGGFEKHTQSENNGVSLISMSNVEIRIKESELSDFRKAVQK